MRDVRHLQHHLRGLGRFVLGYSGGVDSALLAVAAGGAVGSAGFLAVMGRSASYPEAQWRTARDLARRFGFPLRELDTRELDDPRYRANPLDRCYFCKSELWHRLDALARAEGYNVVIDGTNADDLLEHRPGLAAAAERGVRSPLAELGWSKDAVRAAARELGLPTWDAPASPCLASRIRHGLAVTPERLRQVEEAEAFLRGLGIAGDLRVRHLGDRASIEVGPAEFGAVDAHAEEIALRLCALGFVSVERDPRGYRRGALAVLEPVRG